MIKLKPFLILFFLSAGFVFTINFSMATKPQDDIELQKRFEASQMLADIQKEFNEIKRQLSGGDADIKDLVQRLDKNKKDLEKAYDGYFATIKADKSLIAQYNQCDNLKSELETEIQLQESTISKNEEKNKLLITLETMKTDYKSMVQYGYFFCDDKNKKALDSLKKEASKTIDAKIEKERGLHQALFEEDADVMSLNDSIVVSQKILEELEVKPFNWNIIWQGAIILACLFVVGNMIYNNIKNKKMFNKNSKNDIPKI